MMIKLYSTAGADDLFSGSVKKAESSDEEPEVATKKPSGGGLFADDEDDLFSVTPAKKEPPKRKEFFFTWILSLKMDKTYVPWVSLFTGFFGRKSSYCLL